MDDFDLEHNDERLPASDSATTVTVSLNRTARALPFVKLQQNIRTRESFEQDPEFDEDDEYYYDDPNLEEDVARIGTLYPDSPLGFLLTLSCRGRLPLSRGTMCCVKHR